MILDYIGFNFVIVQSTVCRSMSMCIILGVLYHVLICATSTQRPISLILQLLLFLFATAITIETAVLPLGVSGLKGNQI